MTVLKESRGSCAAAAAAAAAAAGKVGARDHDWSPKSGVDGLAAVLEHTPQLLAGR